MGFASSLSKRNSLFRSLAAYKRKTASHNAVLLQYRFELRTKSF
jgi:hypothetical protein